MQQIATGSSQQSEYMNRAVQSIDETSRAIQGVARGAQEQSAAVHQVSGLSSHISEVMKQVTGAAQTGAQGAREAAEAASSGTQTVRVALHGMGTIREKVVLLAEKVDEMGRRSGQIGQILETIDDIASQTNLLALNAAIEAARAGEHGKGFAVVAVEVRKLAEKSTLATKEIASLIQGIQVTISEATQAMQEGVREVDHGVDRAGESSQALEIILERVAMVNHQVEEIQGSTHQLTSAAGELSVAMDSVSAIVEENTAATEEMSASTEEMTRSMESIASVSEESNAAIEEVSASAEEMNAQIEDVLRSAQSLERMSGALQEMVRRFQLDGAQPAERAASRGGGSNRRANFAANAGGQTGLQEQQPAELVTA
jgi:methyl-accepting chemotaxis protein